MPVPIFTVGHADRTPEELLAMLHAAGVRTVADIRTRPASRRFPWFAQAQVAAALEAAGIGYLHLRDLGGLRPDPGHRPDLAGLDPIWRPYAAHMQTPAFADGVTELLALADTEGPVAALCAERDPERCHRSLLADALVVGGRRVIHLVRPGDEPEHRLRAEAVVGEDGVVRYPERQGELGL